jgi:hypothetical protein
LRTAESLSLERATVPATGIVAPAAFNVIEVVEIDAAATGFVKRTMIAVSRETALEMSAGNTLATAGGTPSVTVTDCGAVVAVRPLVSVAVAVRLITLPAVTLAGTLSVN